MAHTVPKLVRLDKPALPTRFGISNSPIGFMFMAWQNELLTHLFVLPAGAEEQADDIIADNHWPTDLKADHAAAKALVKTILFPANEWQGNFPNTLQVGFYGTDFQWKTMQAMNKIVSGKTSSYALLAKTAGNDGASRAAGSVCAKNPVPLIIPCHRVLTSQGGLGGYAYGVALKRQLLAWEKSSEK